MPGAGTQMQFSAHADWWNDRPQPREDLWSGTPFVGRVAGETPALPYSTPETRRKDVGLQRYGDGTPSTGPTLTDRHGLAKPRKSAKLIPFQTSHGEIRLEENKLEDTGFMPTALAVNFLRSEYLGSRAPVQPTRFFK